MASTPARIAGYTVLDLPADGHVTADVRWPGGVSNLANCRDGSRVFLIGASLEPADSCAVYGGAAYDF